MRAAVMCRARRDPISLLVALGVIGGAALYTGWRGALVATASCLALARPRATPALIIVCWLAWTVPGMLYTGHPITPERRAHRFIANLEKALDEYRADHGVYPPSDDRLGGRALVTHLDGDPGNGGPAKLYHEYRSRELRDGEPVDPWGQPYRYSSRGGRASVWSDGEPEGGGIVGAWPWR